MYHTWDTDTLKFSSNAVSKITSTLLPYLKYIRNELLICALVNTNNNILLTDAL